MSIVGFKVSSPHDTSPFGTTEHLMGRSCYTRVHHGEVGPFDTCVNRPGFPPGVCTEVVYQSPFLCLPNHPFFWYDIRWGHEELGKPFPKGVSLQLAPLVQVMFLLYIDRSKVLSLGVFSPDVEVCDLWVRIYAPGPLLQLCSSASNI